MKLLLVADKENAKYCFPVRNCLDGHTVSVPKVTYPFIAPYITAAKKEGFNAILLSHAKILDKLVYAHTSKVSKENSSLQKWAGTIFQVDGIDILVSRPFKQVVTQDYVPYLLKHLVRKLAKKAYYTPPQMQWRHMRSVGDYEQALEHLKSALYIAVDIETTCKSACPDKIKKATEEGLPVKGLVVPMKNSSKRVGAPAYLPTVPLIDMIGYCGMFQNPDGSLYSMAYVMDINTMEDIYWMRRFNTLPAPKICQNGGYEGTHLVRYNAPLHNWLCDTFHFAHCHLAEMPRKLNDLSSYWLANYEYWKDEMGSDRALYNAKDCYNTLWIWAFQCREMEEYTKTNYLIEFRKVFPDICCGLEGFRVDEEEKRRLAESKEKIVARSQSVLDKVVYRDFNANSPKQVLAVMNALSLVKFTKSDDKALTKWSDVFPLNHVIHEAITEQRKARKSLSTYINATLLDGRLLYELNHGGTDTARTASKSSNLWCGTQIQNIDNKLRSMYVADTVANGAGEDWELNNQDGSQAESRTTAYISEDAALMDTVETAPDFHARNASLFFGIPESDIIKVEKDANTGKVLDVKVINAPIRKLSKPVNHGSNYNMGPFVLLQTMGNKNVWAAKRLLNLPSNMGLIAVCKYLLRTFELTYPDIKGKYYDEVFEEIRITGRLKGATGWTRVCFSTPHRGGHKPTINKYVAHLPQNLSSMILDEAYVDFWLEYQIRQRRARLKAPVHDEVVFQSRPKDSKELRMALGSLISRPYIVKGRSLVIPTDGGGTGYRWSELK